MALKRTCGAGLALLAGLLAAGCGGDSDGKASDVDGFISQLCAEFSTCCGAAGLPTDGAQCRAFYGAFAPREGFDSDAAGACLDEIHATGDAKCSGDVDTPSCDKVFAGSAGAKQPGEACDDDSDCAPAAMGKVSCETDFVDGATVRKCQVQLPGVAGSSPCIATKDGNITFGEPGLEPMGYVCDVADGLACDDTTKACKALSKLGEACTSTLFGCVSEGYCDFSTQMCKARAAIGEACTSDSNCAVGAYCDDASSSCAAQLAAKSACTQSAQCLSGSCTNGVCEAATNLTLVFLCGSN